MKLSVPHIDKKDISSINKTLKSQYVSTSSKNIKVFENKISNFCGTKFAVALNSGTSALHLALRILGVDKNSEVIVPSLTFIATVNPILYLGAKPIILDVDDNHNIKIDDVISFIKTKTVFKGKKTLNKKTKKILKVIIVAHMWGRACNFSKLKKICKKRNIYILEDAAEALGSFVKTKKEQHCGSIGDIGCLSFNGNKIITTGSGGAIITNKKKFYTKAQYFSNQAKDDEYNYIHNQCGYNYKMNGLSAALGISQLKKLKKKILKRKDIYKRYLENFKNEKYIELLRFPKDSKINYWMNIVSLKKLNFKQTQQVGVYLAKKKIETRRIWRPLNLQNYLRNCQKYRLSNSNKFYSNSICIPSDDDITLKEIDKISDYIKKYYEIVSNNKFEA